MTQLAATRRTTLQRTSPKIRAQATSPIMTLDALVSLAATTYQKWLLKSVSAAILSNGLPLTRAMVQCALGDEQRFLAQLSAESRKRQETLLAFWGQSMGYRQELLKGLPADLICVEGATRNAA